LKQNNNISVGVIGAGMMGIDVARRLSAEGFKVSVLEAESKPGGLTGTWKFGEYEWDKFYHVILPYDTYTLSLISDIGLENELCWEETKTGFFINGNYYSMSNVAEFLKFPALNLFEKFRLGLTILAGSYMRNYKRLERIPVSDWIIRWSGKNVYEKIWLPLLKSKLGEDYKLTSAAFICSTIRRLYGARKSGSKKEVFGYVNGGYSTILKALSLRVESEKIELLTGFKVIEIKKTRIDEFEVISQSGEKKIFNTIICTLPSSIISNICPQLTFYEKEKLNSIRYMGVVCTTLLLKNPLTPYYVTNITDPDNPFTGVIEMTALVNSAYFGGKSLVYLPKYVNPDNPLFYESEALLKASSIEYLKTMQPALTSEDIIASEVVKARHVIALPELGYSDKLPSVRTSLKDFYIVNSSFITDGTLNVNETLRVSAGHINELIKFLRDEE
jgi:protoporphyrinogen oxidase